MLNVEKVFNLFLAHDVDFFTGVPDSLLKNICAYITDHASAGKHIIAANEGTAVGIAAGYYMASGKLPLVYMQNSGLGNTVNPLLSLADEKVYSLPILAGAVNPEQKMNLSIKNKVRLLWTYWKL